MAKRILLVTGTPGIGKTTVLKKIVGILQSQGFQVGGILSQEVREDGNRVGFEIIDLGRRKSAWLAHVKQKTGPTVGKYRVNLAGLETVGAKAIDDAVQFKTVIAIDEIGPMELFSLEFVKAVKNAVESSKPVIATIHWKPNRIKKELIARTDIEVVEVTPQNRDSLSDIIAQKIVLLLS